MGPYHRERESSEIAECKIFLEKQKGSEFQYLHKHILDNISLYRKMYDRKLENIDSASLSCMLARDATLLKYVLVEYAERNYPFQTQSYNDYILPRRHFWPILRDGVLMENQIPIDLLLKTMGKDLLWSTVHKVILHIYPFRSTTKEGDWKQPIIMENCYHLLDYLYQICTHNVKEYRKAERSDVQIPGATQLRAAGIHFEPTGDLSTIRFVASTSTLHLPIVKMYSETETWFRNLIAYEQCRSDLSVPWCSYMRLMASLIETPKDVKLMRENKMLLNLMGSNEAVAKVWNKLGENVELFLTERDKGVMESINAHCGSNRKVWAAELCYRYFSSPWSFVSFVAASLLLIMTFLQTFFTIKQSL